jgi:hypothetical protein
MFHQVSRLLPQIFFRSEAPVGNSCNRKVAVTDEHQC